ncbi:hypothetical protein AOQ84DRAFT_346151 [Glonium stellatum]|uniref:Saccharopine dehydrogenase NADP binding domain-containing protein n=1 Tax=Glonium stellatum TaxID=574774 RepID=A0A8E2JPP1_9PEZI|nr:hypothetical protein AOQ84DRAFT_346151 [Glonium stellatum]
MADTTRPYELVLLGANGYTGKMTAEHIAQYLPTDLKWAIAGRSSKKLADVAEELKKLNPDRLPPSIEICELKKDELDTLVKKTRIVITTIGPFMKYGEPVVEACANSGTHYLDCTGEVPWVKDMIEKYDETAKKNGAIMIPQCGLDSVPADLLAYILSRHIRSTLSAPTASVIVSLHAFKSGISGGTANTMLDLFDHYPLSHLGASMKPYALSPVQPMAPTPPPSSGLLHRLLGIRYVPELGTLTDGLMASVDTSIAHRSWGLYTQSPDPDAAYGPRFRFTEYMRAKNTFTAALIHYAFLLGFSLLLLPPTRALLSPLLRRRLPLPGAGPAKDAIKKEFLNYRAVGVADTQRGERALARLEFGGGAYMLTGVTLAEAAMVMLRGDLGATEAGRRGGGLLTPATLGDQFVERLKKVGVKIEVRMGE